MAVIAAVRAVMMVDHVLRQRYEPPEELVPRVWVIAEPVQYVAKDGVGGVEQQIVIRTVVRAANLPHLAARIVVHLC